MDIKLIQTTLNEALQTYPAIYDPNPSLYLSRTSAMGHIIQNILDKDPVWSRMARYCKVWLAFYEGELVGWCWLFRNPKSDEKRLSFFVFCQPRVRKLGVGRKLFLAAQQFAKDSKRGIMVYPWNRSSDKFYAKLKVKSTSIKYWSW